MSTAAALHRRPAALGARAGPLGARAGRIRAGPPLGSPGRIVASSARAGPALPRYRLGARAAALRRSADIAGNIAGAAALRPLPVSSARSSTGPPHRCGRSSSGGARAGPVGAELRPLPGRVAALRLRDREKPNENERFPETGRPAEKRRPYTCGNTGENQIQSERTHTCRQMSYSRIP